MIVRRNMRVRREPPITMIEACKEFLSSFGFIQIEMALIFAIKSY
jgi:hypothetical protein